MGRCWRKGEEIPNLTLLQRMTDKEHLVIYIYMYTHTLQCLGSPGDTYRVYIHTHKTTRLFRNSLYINILEIPDVYNTQQCVYIYIYVHVFPYTSYEHTLQHHACMLHSFSRYSTCPLCARTHNQVPYLYSRFSQVGVQALWRKLEGDW